MHFDRLKPYVGRELVGWESLELPVTPVQRRQEEPLVEEGVIGGVEENHEDSVVSATPGPMEWVQENTETVEDQEKRLHLCRGEGTHLGIAVGLNVTYNFE